MKKCRPYVVVSNDGANKSGTIMLVVPLTIVLKRLDMPTHAVVCGKDAAPVMALCEQVRPTDCYEYPVEFRMLPHAMDEIDLALRNAFWFKEGDHNA